MSEDTNKEPNSTNPDVVKDVDGDFWIRTEGDIYRWLDNNYLPLSSGRRLSKLEKGSFAPLTRYAPVTHCAPVEPEAEPEERTLTWRKDGTGCTWGELVAEFREGRQVERFLVAGDGTVVAVRGKLKMSWGASWWIGDHALLSVGCGDRITVWLPEVPEVPEWAQDCEEWDVDRRLVATDDRRVWMPYDNTRGVVSTWYARGGKGTTATTEELAKMKPRLIVDRDGKVVL